MLSVLAYIYSKKLGMDTEKCAKMALVHDIGEAFSGDIPDRVRGEERSVPLAKKRKLEADGMEKMLALLPAAEANEIRGLWEEFCTRKTKEAQLVRDLDKLEMCMQALEYAKNERNAGARRKFAEFFEDGALNIRTPNIRKVFEKVHAGFKLIAERNRDDI
jgi:putative hydrolase of HD superfamily